MKTIPPTETPCPRRALESAPPDAQILYFKVGHARRFIAELDAEILLGARFESATGCPFDSPSQLGPVIASLDSPTFRRHAGARAWLAVVEASNEYADAAALIEPLVAARDALDRAQLDAADARSRALSSHTVAVENARQAALAAVAKDPGVLAAVAALEKLSQ